MIKSNNDNLLIDNIKSILEEKIRPTINNDGGDISFVKFEDGVVYVRLYGACVSCPISFITLKMGVEAQLKENISEVKEVQVVEE